MIWDIILYLLSGALGVTLGTLFVGTTIGLPRRKKETRNDIQNKQ